MGIFKYKFDLTESPKLVYHFAKLIGLAPFTLKDNRLHASSTSGLFYSIAMAVVHLLLAGIATAYTVLQFQGLPLPQGTRIWGVTRYVVCVLPLFFTLAVSLSSHSKVIRLMNKLCDTKSRLDSFGIRENTAKLFSNVNKTTAIANVIIVTMCVITGLTDPNWHIFRSIAYGIGIWFNLNLLLIYIQVFKCIRQRFDKLNERLYELFLRLPMSGRSNDENRGIELIREAEALHLDLSEQLNTATDIFTLPILLNSFQFFCVLVLSGQWVYSSVQLRLFLSHDMFTALLSHFIRIVIAFGQMMMIAHASATTCQRGNATRATLIEIWNEFKSSALPDEYFMFSIQLAGEPVAVSISGIFDLDYSYVYKICGSAITYIIVIIQFGGDKFIRNYNKTLE